MVLAPIAKISTQIAHYALRQYAQDAKQVTSLRTIYAINAVLQDSKDAPHVTLRVASLAILDFSWKMKLVIIVLQDSPLVSLATQHIAKLVQSAMSLIANFWVAKSVQSLTHSSAKLATLKFVSLVKITSFWVTNKRRAFPLKVKPKRFVATTLHRSSDKNATMATIWTLTVVILSAKLKKISFVKCCPLGFQFANITAPSKWYTLTWPKIKM